MDITPWREGDDRLPEPVESGPSPEQQELADKREELLELSDQAAELEMKHSVLRAQVDGFAHDKLFRLGPLLVRIDELELRVAELLLARDQDNPVLQRRAQEAGARAAQSKEASCDAAEQGPTVAVKLTPQMKTTFRTAARRMHPDLGRTPEDIALRHEFMVRLNETYTSGDIEGMEDVLAAFEAKAPPPESLDVPEDLVRVIRAIHRLRKTITRLGRKVEDLRTHEDYLLMIRGRRAEARGEDVFEQAEVKFEARIALLEERVRDLEEGPSE